MRYFARIFALTLIVSSSLMPLIASAQFEGWAKEIATSVILGIVSFFAWLMGITGLLLNFAIYELVVGMGNLIVNDGFGASIEAIWMLIRDLVNLVYVFGILYIGIMMMVEGNSSSAKKLLSSIIVSMLLVNFSLYFTKAIIDVSNLTAYTIYTTMKDGDPGYVDNPSYGPTAVFANAVGAGALLTGGDNKTREAMLKSAAGGELPVSFLIVYGFGASIFLFKLALTFALGAYLLIVRFITLIILMILAPVAFLPKDLKYVGDIREQWWSTLISQAFVAPIYLFGLYLTLLVLTNAPWSATSSRNLATLFTEASFSQSGLITLLFFALAIAMLLGTTMMTKRAAASGAKVSGMVAATLGKALTGGANVGQRTIGLAGRNFSKKEGLRDAAAGSGIRGFAARRALNLSKAAASSSFDARSIIGKSFKEGGVDLGEKSKMSYNKRVEEIEKKEAKYAKDLGEKDKNVAERAQIAGVEDELKDIEKTRSAKAKEYAKATDDATKARLLTEYDTLDKQAKAKNEELGKLKNPRAMKYAETVEKGTLFGFGPKYSRSENKAAAKKIRDEAKKKKKDNDDLIAAIKESAGKKD